MKIIKVVNCAEIADENWTFLKNHINSLNVFWSFYSAKPKLWIELVIRKPNLARYRACFSAALNAKKNNANYVISHLPRTTLWVALFSALFGVRSRHLAYSFNFTELPCGKMKILMGYAFKYVDKFVVFSSVEKQLYANYFKIDSSRIDVIKWCMDTPNFLNKKPMIDGEYICAVGGEGRDYDLLLKSAGILNSIKFVIVARPDNLNGLIIPPNVTVLTNLPVDQYWNVVAFSRFVAIPLKSSSTNCGHITIVGSHLLGKPIVSTYSSGTSDYLIDDINALLSPATDVERMCENLERLWRDESLFKKIKLNIVNANDMYSMENWVAYVETYLSQS